MVKGFTKKLTSELIEHFGNERLVEILDSDIEKLLEFKSITPKRLERLSKQWKLFRSMRELGEFLTPYGVGAALLKRIYEYTKELENAIESIKNNPYILMRVDGIGFKRADEIALNMGVPSDDERRLAAAMEYVLNEYCENEGNSAVDKEVLFERLDALLGLENSTYDDILSINIEGGDIIELPSKKLATARLYNAESYLLEQFSKRAKTSSGTIDENLAEFATSYNLSKKQYEALEVINSGVGILFLVGYAGTGKSTTAKALLDLLASKIDSKLIMTCALSGIASQRIKERSGYESSTIQSLLVRYKSDEQMPYRVLLIDEASMINSSTFARLFSKIADDCVVIVVGDDAQLPPIGAGSVLSDVINLSLAPTVMLTEIFRQRDDQAIAIIANEIRVGKTPRYRDDYEDFRFVSEELANRYMLKNSLSTSEYSEVLETLSNNILSKVATTAIEYIAESRGYLAKKEISKYLSSFMVLSPMKNHTLGVDSLNRVLQSYFNPNPKKSIESKKYDFYLHDKIVHIKNENLPSYSSDEFKEGMDAVARRIYNGMCGVIFRIDEDDEVAFVYYPNEDLIVRYSYDEVGYFLELSYALSIHKTQGMEYDRVAIVMSFSHHIMLNTKLLYTAITRAKKECIIIGESGAFEMASRRVDNTKRYSVMQELAKDGEIN